MKCGECSFICSPNQKAMCRVTQRTYIRDTISLVKERLEGSGRFSYYLEVSEMGMHKHGANSAKAKACKKYSDEGRLAKNKARIAENRRKWMAKKQAIA